MCYTSFAEFMTAIAENRETSAATTKPLERLTSNDFGDIAKQLGAQISILVVDTEGLLKRASLNYLGNVISIDAKDDRRPGVKGPFLMVSSEGVTHRDLPLCNPSVEIAPCLVSFTSTEQYGGRTVDRVVQASKGNLFQASNTKQG